MSHFRLLSVSFALLVVGSALAQPPAPKVPKELLEKRLAAAQAVLREKKALRLSSSEQEQVSGELPSHS